LTTETIRVTGAAGGFGTDTAETPARAGLNLFAPMRGPEAINLVHADAYRMGGGNRPIEPSGMKPQPAPRT
jgi:NADP-dependent 3-hydroxy acid dehydrogenase YdfG